MLNFLAKFAFLFASKQNLSKKGKFSSSLSQTIRIVKNTFLFQPVKATKSSFVQSNK